MKKNKELNQFIHSIPAGTILTSAKLYQQGISAKLAWWYTHKGLLKRVGSKVYVKGDREADWFAVVDVLQNQLNMPIHIGGLTALKLLNRVKINYLIYESDVEEIILFTYPKVFIPTWIKSDNNFKIFSSSLFDDNPKVGGFLKHKIDKFEIKISSPERAIMEVLHLSPKLHELFPVTEWMEKIKCLDASVVQSLLENCNSIKVKRFFLYFVERFWRKLLPKLDVSKIDLGSGKRVIGRGGKYRYYPKYMLSLPVKIDEPDDF